MSIYLKVLIAVACIITMLLSLLGNGLVITVILRYKRLKNATNYILLSLAIADLTVSVLVMLPAMTQDVLNTWIFSQLFCKFYNAFDVTCCTASILHLLLVAIDRYIAIFKPLTYRNMVRKWHVFILVVSIWTLSLCISFIPIFLGWNKPFSTTPSPNQTKAAETGPYYTDTNATDNTTTNTTDLCRLQTNVAFALISSSLSFYIPLVIMIGVYFRIYVIAKRQAKSIAQIQYHATINNKTTSRNNLNQPNTEELLNSKEINQILIQNGECRVSDDKIDKSSRVVKLLKSLKNIEKKRTRDTKAVKTVGIIMGIFIICWLPFFIMYCLEPIILLYNPNYGTPYIIERIITWVGYVNSFINPIVYAFTYRDFRKAYISTLRAIAKRLCPHSVFGRNMFQDENSNSFQNTFIYDNPNYSNRPNKSRCCFWTPKNSNNRNNSVQNGRVNKTNHESKTLPLRDKNRKLLIISKANGSPLPSEANSNHQTLVNDFVDVKKDDTLNKNSIKNEATVLLKRNSLSTSASSCSLDKELEAVANNQEKLGKFEKFNRLSYSYRQEKKLDSKFKKFFSVKIVRNEMNSRLKKKLNYSDNLDDIEIYRV